MTLTRRFDSFSQRTSCNIAKNKHRDICAHWMHVQPIMFLSGKVDFGTGTGQKHFLIFFVLRRIADARLICDSWPCQGTASGQYESSWVSIV